MICSFQTGNELFLNGVNESGLSGTSTRCGYGNCTLTKYVSFDYKLSGQILETHGSSCFNKALV